MTEVLTISDVCAILKVSRTTVYRIIKEKQLKAIRVRKTVRVKMSDLEEYLSAYDEAV
ncbi:MAG: helix-turn-helix domain-containing protein [Clostridia bacterium]|nr:helix-turn-helix domain-containing protein [Clostridia bacterium]